MSSHRLDLDTAVETAVFRALVDVLKADPVLSRVVRTWDVLDGSSKTLEPPSTGMMPFIRLMGGPSQLDLIEAGAWGLKLTVYAMLATAGLNQDDQTNFWGAFRRALGYSQPFRNTTVAEYIRSAGCTLHRMTSPGFGPFPAPARDGPSRAQDLYAAAQIILDITIQFEQT